MGRKILKKRRLAEVRARKGTQKSCRLSRKEQLEIRREELMEMAERRKNFYKNLEVDKVKLIVTTLVDTLRTLKEAEEDLDFCCGYYNGNGELTEKIGNAIEKGNKIIEMTGGKDEL